MADVTQGLMQNLVQYLIIAGLLLWSCYVVLRRFMPKTSFKWQQAFAHWLARQGFVRLAGWLMPTAAQSGCSAGCSDCRVGSSKMDRSKTACGSDMTQASEVQEQPVQWR